MVWPSERFRQPANVCDSLLTPEEREAEQRIDETLLAGGNAAEGPGRGKLRKRARVERRKGGER